MTKANLGQVFFMGLVCGVAGSTVFSFQLLLDHRPLYPTFPSGFFFWAASGMVMSSLVVIGRNKVTKKDVRTDRSWIIAVAFIVLSLTIAFGIPIKAKYDRMSAQRPTTPLR